MGYLRNPYTFVHVHSHSRNPGSAPIVRACAGIRRTIGLLGLYLHLLPNGVYASNLGVDLACGRTPSISHMVLFVVHKNSLPVW